MDEQLPVAEVPFQLSDSDGVTEQTLRGEVEKLLYENEDTGYSVLIIRDTLGNLHNAVGSLPGVSAGQGIEAVGRWEVHKEYGRQFRVLSYNIPFRSRRRGLSNTFLPALSRDLDARMRRRSWRRSAQRRWM